MYNKFYYYTYILLIVKPTMKFVILEVKVSTKSSKPNNN